VPHLAFYAVAEDIAALVAFALADVGTVVYEGYSVPDEPLRTFADAGAVLAALGENPHGMGLMLFASTMKGAPVKKRFNLKPGAVRGKSWRERISGWGLIQLEFSGVRKGKLVASWMNHNSERRALAWESTYPQLGPAASWDFQEVARISRRVNRHVITRLAVRKEEGRVVLRGAQALIDAGDVVLGAA
jgi:hypothetical protein